MKRISMIQFLVRIIPYNVLSNKFIIETPRKQTTRALSLACRPLHRIQTNLLNPIFETVPCPPCRVIATLEYVTADVLRSSPHSKLNHPSSSTLK